MRSKTEKSDWLVFARRNLDPKVRLFCFPFAGGSPAVFRNWSDVLPEWCDVGIVQLPGRGSRLFEEPCRRIEFLLEALMTELSPFLDEPFAFFGHSMGAVLAFELARLRRAQGAAQPSVMFVSGCVAPQVYRKERPLFDLPENELIAELRALNGTPPELLENAELMELVLPALRADFALLHYYSYRHEPPLDLPIVAFGGDADRDVALEELGAWREQTTGEFSMKVFEGDHFFLLSQVLPLLESVERVLFHRFEKRFRRMADQGRAR